MNILAVVAEIRAALYAVTRANPVRGVLQVSADYLADQTGLPVHQVQRALREHIAALHLTGLRAKYLRGYVHLTRDAERRQFDRNAVLNGKVFPYEGAWYLEIDWYQPPKDRPLPRYRTADDALDALWAMEVRSLVAWEAL